MTPLLVLGLGGACAIVALVAHLVTRCYTKAEV